MKVHEENGVRDYQLTETAFKVLTLNTLTSAIFADLTPPPPAVTPQAQSVSLLPTPSATELLTAEIEVWYALHRLKACLGEPLELVRGGSSRIEVQGLAESRQRKEEVIAALQGIPLVTAKIQTVEEATIAPPLSSVPTDPREQLKAPSSEDFPIVEVQRNKLPEGSHGSARSYPLSKRQRVVHRSSVILTDDQPPLGLPLQYCRTKYESQNRERE